MSEGIANVDDSENEITPEMMKAGLKVFWRFNRDFDSGEDIVEDIFTAMMSVRAESVVMD